MYPEEIALLTSRSFWIGVGVVALFLLILRALLKAWLIRLYRKDPDAFMARIERNRRRAAKDPDWWEEWEAQERTRKIGLVPGLIPGDED